MAVTLTVVDAYCTTDQADGYLELVTTWDDTDDDVKEDALLWGRYYLDQNFYIDLSEITAIVVPDELIFANALLAADYISDPSVFQHTPSVKEESVKAGSVSSKTVYLSSGQEYPASWLKIRAILQDKYARRSASTVELLRG